MSGSQGQARLQGRDYTVMAAYMLVLLAIGAFLRKRADIGAIHAPI